MRTHDPGRPPRAPAEPSRATGSGAGAPAGGARVAALRALQHGAGNAAVMRMVRAGVPLPGVGPPMAPARRLQRLLPGQQIPSLANQATAHFEGNALANADAAEAVFVRRAGDVLDRVLNEGGFASVREAYFAAVRAITLRGLYHASREGHEAIQKHMSEASGGAHAATVARLFETELPTAVDVGLERSARLNQFLEERAGVRIATPITPARAAELSERLAATDFVKAFELRLRRHLGVGYVPPGPLVAAEGRWKDGRSLHSAPTFSFTVAEEDSGYQAVGDAGGEAAITAKLRTADDLVRAIVDPAVLGLLPAPKVRVVSVSGHRAYQSPEVISVGLADPVEVIVHEVGHYLESNLPPELWHDVALLREHRHAAATSGLAALVGGGRTAVAGPAGLETEGRYAGTYAATGPYTSKVYEGSGATEVVSTTLQMFGDPAKFPQLIAKDPLQMAIVLRRLRPADAQLNAIWADFAAYLPNAPAAAPAAAAPAPAAAASATVDPLIELTKPLLSR